MERKKTGATLTERKKVEWVREQVQVNVILVGTEK